MKIEVSLALLKVIFCLSNIGWRVQKMPPKAPKRAYSTGRWCAIINCPFKVSNAVNDGERKFVLWPTKESVQKQWSKVSFLYIFVILLWREIFWSSCGVWSIVNWSAVSRTWNGHYCRHVILCSYGWISISILLEYFWMMPLMCLHSLLHIDLPQACFFNRFYRHP